MKALSLGFFILVTVFVLTAALPEEKDKDQQSLLDSTDENEQPLQRRRPPIKVPGPKLKKTDETIENNPNPLADDDRGKKKGKKDVNLTKDDKQDDLPSLDDDKRGERGKKGKGKDKDLVKEDEETQEERDVEKPKS